MTARAADLLDLRAVSELFDRALRAQSGIVGSVLPTPLAAGAAAGWTQLVPSLFGLRRRLRVFVEEQHGEQRAAALVFEGTRPEWVVLLLVAADGPAGADGAFRLLSEIAASAAQHGMHRIFGAVPDETRAKETFFQAGFYSYTRETWYVSRSAALARPSRELPSRAATGRDAHDLFRFYVATTPHAVQHAEQLSVQDFDVSRRAGALDPPHLVGGNPLRMRRAAAIVVGDDVRRRAFAVAFRGLDRHPHVCKVRTADGDVDLARDLVRAVARELAPSRPLSSPVRSYEEHVARALLAEGFQEAATAMLFVKELAIRIEEPALAHAPAVVR